MRSSDKKMLQNIHFFTFYNKKKLNLMDLMFGITFKDEQFFYFKLYQIFLNNSRIFKILRTFRQFHQPVYKKKQTSK